MKPLFISLSRSGSNAKAFVNSNSIKVVELNTNTRNMVIFAGNEKMAINGVTDHMTNRLYDEIAQRYQVIRLYNASTSFGVYGKTDSASNVVLDITIGEKRTFIFPRGIKTVKIDVEGTKKTACITTTAKLTDGGHLLVPYDSVLERAFNNNGIVRISSVEEI